MPSVEYLTVIESTNTFCDSIVTFNKLLQVDSCLVISGEKIKFRDDFTCSYKITSGEITSKDQRYFHTYFSIDSNSETDLNRFSEFLKTVRVILSKVGSQPETLWDDISLHYSKLSYAIIHRIESLMRKLIANFMLITVGNQWINETTPQEIKEVISKNKRKEHTNILHNVDFIHLADFLLKPYSNTSNVEILKKLKATVTIEDLNLLQTLLPESNWNRYFSKLVNCDDTFLQKRWSDLYELRCKVAHNAIVSYSDFEKISSIASDLESKFLEALENLPQVKVPEIEVSNIVENAIPTTRTSVSDFIASFRMLEKHLSQMANKLGFSSRGPLNAARFLMTGGVMNIRDQTLLRAIIDMRNRVIHGADDTITDFEISLGIEMISDLIDSFGFTRGHN